MSHNQWGKLAITMLGALLAGSAAVAQPMPPMDPAPQGQPGIPYSGAPLTAENQSVIDALMAMGLKPYFTLTPQQARLQPSFADGVMAAMRARGLPTAPPPGTTERNMSIPGAAGQINAKVVTPTGVRGPMPVILYFHGGGWVLADSTLIRLLRARTGQSLGRDRGVGRLSARPRGPVPRPA